jgi:hypothetical protein
MEAALLSGFLNTILTKLLCLAEEKYKVYNGVKDDLVFLDKELRMISSFVDEKLFIFYCFDKDYTRLNESMPTLEAMFGWWLKNTAHGNKLVEWHSFKKILSMLAL